MNDRNIGKVLSEIRKQIRLYEGGQLRSSMAAWECGKIINSEWGMPPRPGYYLQEGHINASEWDQLERESGRSRTTLSFWRRFHKEFPDVKDAEEFAIKCGSIHTVRYALSSKRPDKGAAIHEKNWKARNADAIRVTIPADFSRELMEAGHTKRQIQRVYLAYHNFPEIKDDIRKMLSSGEGSEVA